MAKGNAFIIRGSINFHEHWTLSLHEFLLELGPAGLQWNRGAIHIFIVEVTQGKPVLM